MEQSSGILQRFNQMSLNRLLMLILVGSVIFGTGAGYLLSINAQTGNSVVTPAAPEDTKDPAKSAASDNRTFRDFAEGTIKKREVPKNNDTYVEGTHVLVRDKAVPVALTSSVVDLSEYEGKKVKVLGETQKAIKEGWLMDVGKVEVLQ